MYLVKIKAPVEQPNGEVKRVSTAILVRHAVNLTDLDVKLNEYFEKQPENFRSFVINSVSRIRFNDILQSPEEPEYAYWKVKVALSESSDEGKPQSNTMLVQSETLEKAYDRVKASFKNTSFDVEFKNGSEFKLLDIIQDEILEGVESDAKDSDVEI